MTNSDLASALSPQWDFVLDGELQFRKGGVRLLPDIRDCQHESIHRYTQRLAGLHAIDQAILAAKHPHDIARAAASHLRRLVNCQQVMVVLFDLEAEHAEVIAGDASTTLAIAEGTRLSLTEWLNASTCSDIKANASPPSSSHALRSIPNLTACQSPFFQGLKSLGLQSALVVPLVVKEALIGAISLADPEQAAFTSEHIDIACEIADHLAVAIQNAHLFERGRIDSERLQTLSSRLLEAQEMERRHIAHELHDEIGQALTAVKINLQVLQRTLRQRLMPSSQEDQSAELSPIQDSIAIVDTALQQVRNLSLDLRPSLLDDLGLVAALRWYIDRQSQRTGIQEEFFCALGELDLRSDLATACFRIVQEALTNIAKHAHAHYVSVRIEQHQHELLLTIQDDGVGFDVMAAWKQASQGKSLGLLGINERATLVGGRLKIVSTRGEGTTIYVHFPIDLC